jgi:hypothetical protein
VNRRRQTVYVLRQTSAYNVQREPSTSNGLRPTSNVYVERPTYAVDAKRFTSYVKRQRRTSNYVVDVKHHRPFFLGNLSNLALLSSRHRS